MRQARIAVAAEVALEDAAVLGAVEHRAPGFQFADAVGRFLGVQLGHAPVIQVLAAAHGVGKVDLPVVAVVHVAHGRRHAAFGHHGVRFAEQRFGDHADLDAGGRGFNGGAQAGAARADDQDVVFMNVRYSAILKDSPVRPDAHRAHPHVEVGEADRRTG